ncbi:splicing factor 3A subunit 1-like [Styela clava]
MAPIVQVQQKGADEQGIRIQGDAPEPVEEEATASKPIIGIIYPPPEVRNIVDKTASFVARNGPEFEARIRQNEANNSKFNFLSPTDPYHAYYRHKVKEFLEGKGQEPAAPKAPIKGTVKPAVAAVQDQFIPKDPPASFEFIAEPPSISAYDLDVVRLTAQFVARNGRSFLTQLMQKETKNYQFDFLRPQHALFQYFTKLVEQYTKILIPPKNLMAKLKIEGENPKKILDDVKYRVEWTKHEDRIKAREKEAIEKERLAYSQIGWHDFVVVETVDFQPTEMGNFPSPVTINELGARLLQQERYEKYGEEGDKDVSDDEEKPAPQREPTQNESESEDESEEEMETVSRKRDEPQAEQPQLVDMDMEESSDEEDVEKPQPLPPTSGDVIIRRGYDPKQRQPDHLETSSDGKWMISPLTGERVPAEKFQEHMRYGLLDPNWKEQRKRQIAEKQQDEEVFAGGTDIEHALKGLAERRTDIFGVEETAIGKKVGEEEAAPEDRVMWDGHSGSAESTQRKAAQGVTVDDQIEAIKKAQGIIMDESKSSIGPSTTKPNNAPKPVPKPQPSIVQVTQHRQPVQMVQIQQVPQRQVLTPVVVRPMINVVPQQQQVLVVQQPMTVQHVVQQPPPQMLVQQNPPQMMQQMHQPQQQFSQPEPEGPPSKRQRTEANLIPEGQFLAHNHGPVMFRVACPTADRADWNLKGQMLTFTLPLTDEVSVIKAKIHEATGMPGGKQKLQLDGLFIKDSNSLAFYNMTNGSVINLQVKERGGRKK